jgi:deferrochelatase/peroxidase EfeB
LRRCQGSKIRAAIDTAAAKEDAAIVPLVVSLATTYLWPLALPLLLVLGVGLWRGTAALRDALVGTESLFAQLWLLIGAVWSGVVWLGSVALALGVLVAVALGILYLSLRRKEASDWTSDAAPDPAVLHQILAVENRYAHNHMVSVTTIKPGLTRMITLRFAFWIIESLARLRFRPGFLGEIGTIHFARWVTLPGTRQLAFFSNYGGSWESYLEDFITLAHNGLTAIWSNTVGFPRTRNLFQEGATDGERFKRYARQSMLPSPFWYSAYPELTTANIRTNAAIRRGIAAVMTDEEAIAWLSLFGSAIRPAAKLESDQIQSIVFGGLGFLPFGTLLLIDFADDREAVRRWLRSMLPDVAFNDGRRFQNRSVLTMAVGPGALRKAGLPADAITSFPQAYLDGMTGPGRARILGDDLQDAAYPWWWKTDGTYDVALLVYGPDAESVAELKSRVVEEASKAGHQLQRDLPLHQIPDALRDRKEPFGFVDGVSQPVIRGTYRALRNSDPIHLVEPGEFILGYPDNRGNRPPGPSLNAMDDPDNMLPVLCDAEGGFSQNIVDAPREIGRNGSFLVIRHLEQEVEDFNKYCEHQARRLQGRLGYPYQITAEFIAAKLIGRWRNGSSLVRNPYHPYKTSRDAAEGQASRPTLRARTQVDEASIAPPSSAPAAASGAGAGDAEDRETQDNDYLFGTEDPQGLRCPFGAHVRRANPRDSFTPGSQDQIDISNRHRILRIGRTYVPGEGQKDGLMFMCLNGDIERQFEFVQQTWLGSSTFHGLSGERDPLTGTQQARPNSFTVPSRDGPIRLTGMSRFVIARGGGYFFVPGKRLLEYLCRPREAGQPISGKPTCSGAKHARPDSSRLPGPPAEERRNDPPRIDSGARAAPCRRGAGRTDGRRVPTVRATRRRVHGDER